MGTRKRNIWIEQMRVKALIHRVEEQVRRLADMGLVSGAADVVQAVHHLKNAHWTLDKERKCRRLAKEIV